MFSWKDNKSCRAHSVKKELVWGVDEQIKSRDKNAAKGIYDVVTSFVWFFISYSMQIEALQNLKLKILLA